MAAPPETLGRGVRLTTLKNELGGQFVGFVETRRHDPCGANGSEGFAPIVKARGKLLIKLTPCRWRRLVCPLQGTNVRVTIFDDVPQ